MTDHGVSETDSPTRRATHRRTVPAGREGRKVRHRVNATPPAPGNAEDDPYPEELVRRRPLTNALLRGLNAVVAGVALAVLSPLMLLIAVAIKLDSRGPVFYRQVRIGLDRRALRAALADPRGAETGDLDESAGRRSEDLGGRPFTIYKFRTMHVDAERQTGPVWASLNDHRTTRVGRFLRHYRLDEIPQFLNVLKGEMAVVGPRPERPSFVTTLKEELEEYRLRQRVPPGITGWAQVNHRPDQDLNDVQRKLQYDLEYLRRRSLAFDLRIMLKTLPVMFEGIRDQDRARETEV